MASSEIAEHLKGLEGYARTCHESDTIPNLEEVFAYIKCLRQAYGLITENDFGFDSKLWVILKKIADSVDGVLFVCDSLVDTKDLVIFGPLGSDE
ncbi:MAG: hypothetical protein O7G85_07560 [Planctomycetota bacterium]|nr:hypothetical protein [Planctomycetota bacterium]